MKYNIKHLLCGTMACLALSSCSSFLDESPDSELTNENWGSGGKDNATEYTTASQMEQLLTGAYGDFANEFWQLDLYIMNDAQADNAYAGEPKDQTMQIDELRISASNGSVKRDWGYLYSHISKANTIIEWIPKIKDSALTEQRRNEISGEAHFMRAICYFYLVRIYGDVPLITQYIPEISLGNIDEIYPLLYPEKETVENIYTQIVSDLEYSEANVTDYSTNKFKISKAFVRLILAQVYATKDGFSNTDWNKVKQYSQAVVQDTRYGMLDNYNDLFAVAETPSNGVLPSVNLVNEHSKESIFEVDYNSWTTLGNWAAQMFYGIDWKKFNTPSQDLYKAFTSAGDVVRRDASIMFGDVTGKWTDKYWPSNKYPYCYKLRSQEAGNIVLFRLPEAILLLAEAENELGNLNEAKNQINKVRARAELANTTATSKDNMRLAIENENRFEFAFEGKRWMDLKRRNRFKQVMQSCTDHQSEFASRISDEKLIWPIPQSELDLNANLTQNPGY
ncbi:RagB/SusD family nutrient uptake outer membrane protein [Dysgonomonas macrotermitis]|uniref:Starch-binding associating with outer membrane n=1 Tax=Dysgonomonas macrotermitis TaxID=1346286 RepID=A0A1M5F9N9_9BACT|nr:RagB/SusD family nutrient uptake outer membrane protein [Dysgonomonas macrotermitis]SHF88245.1 Starch-binding associating with outer membrane [Dysgonomonas macrotermitis]